MPPTPSAGAPSPFAPEVQAAVTAHMNGDHANDNVLIVRAFGGAPHAASATMTGYDAGGIHFDVVEDRTDGTEVPTQVVVPWGTEIIDRATIRTEVVRMYHDACEALGVAPRPGDEH